MQELLNSHRREGKTPVVYLDTSLVRSMKHDSLKELMEKIHHHGLKVYQTRKAEELLKYSKPCVIRYGYLPDSISRKITSKGGVILSGDL